MKVLVCGSRTWSDYEAVRTVLSGIHETVGDRLTVIHGGARGADACAARWCRMRLPDITEHVFEAAWEDKGRAAGPIRNQQMLDSGQPDEVWAFADDLATSKGTADMVRRARAADVPVYVVSRAS